MGELMGIIDLAQLAGTLGAGSALPWLFRQASRVIGLSTAREATRLQTLEALVDALRRALDKGRLREDALAQVLGVLIFGLKQIEDISPGLSDAIERAIAILEKAQNQLQSMGESR